MKNILKYIAIPSAIVAVIVLILFVVNASIKESELQKKIDLLESRIKQLEDDYAKKSSEFTNLNSSYRSLVTSLILNRKITSSMIDAFLPKDERKIINEQTLPPGLSLPVDVTVYFIPSGWFGDGERGEEFLSFQPMSGYVQISYRPGPKGFAGIYWQYPEHNWGEFRGRNIRRAKRVQFDAKGVQGNEQVEFKVGGIKTASGGDTFEKSLGTVTLTTGWQHFEISLVNQDLSNVIGGFAWTANKSLNPNGLSFFLKDIKYTE